MKNNDDSNKIPIKDRVVNIRIAVFLNIIFTFIELIGGILTNSLAILSDALHDFGDSIVLIVALVMEKKAKKPADNKRTFGYQRLSLLASLFSAVVLITGSLFILSKAIPRLINPEHVNAGGMIIIAIIGVILNGMGFLRLKKGESQNEKTLSWHLLEDVLGWIVILIGGIIIKFWDNHIIDPIITVGFTSFILWGTIKNVRETFNIFLEGVPKHVDLDKLKKSVLSIKGIKRIHDLHIWSMEGETTILTAHIVVEEKYLKNPDKLRKIVKENLAHHHIKHSTIEIESEKYCSGKECYFNSNNK